MRPTSFLGCMAALAVPVATPAMAGPLAPIWTGVYVGANAGGGWGSVQEAISGVGLDASGIAGGVHAGVNLKLGPIFAGLEGDATLLSASGAVSGPLNTSVELDFNWMATLRGRAGLAIGPALLYGTGGIAWGEGSLAVRSGNATLAKISETRQGFVIGAGIEARILPNVSARIEGLHYMFNSEKLDLSRYVAGATTSIEPSFTVVRAGVSFHLN